MQWPTPHLWPFLEGVRGEQGGIFLDVFMQQWKSQIAVGEGHSRVPGSTIGGADPMEVGITLWHLVYASQGLKGAPL